MYNTSVQDTAPRQGNRDALLAAARHCIETNGYARTTARDVTAAAGVSLGAVGYHFGSVEALLNEALMSATADSIRRFDSLVSAGAAEDIRSVARRASHEFSHFLSDNRPLLIGFIEALAQAERVPSLRTQLAGQYEEFRSTAATLFTQVIGSDLTAFGVDEDLLGSVLVALADGLIIQHLLDPDRTDLAERIFAAVESLLP